MEEVIAVFIPFGAFIMVFGIIYVVRTAINREKMLMLEKGFTPQQIADSLNKKNSLSNGMFFVGGGIGVLIGYFLTTISTIEPKIAYIASGVLFAGLGLVIAHLIQAKKEEQA